MEDPDWLVWARELQAIAQTGLTFCRDPYDREGYEAIRQLAARIFAARTDAPVERIEALFAGETGYATPKVDVRAAVFDDDERVLSDRAAAG
jgi:Hydrolase of X-linked nucleoside diphosphate N terminal